MIYSITYRPSLLKVKHPTRDQQFSFLLPESLILLDVTDVYGHDLHRAISHSFLLHLYPPWEDTS